MLNELNLKLKTFLQNEMKKIKIDFEKFILKRNRI